MPLEPYLGEIMYIAGAFAPKGWAVCNGQALPLQQNQALFALIGTRFGGDGRTSFNLPDLRGRAPIGTLPSGGAPVGQASGSELHQLTPVEMPGHTHGLSVNASQSAADNSETPTNGATLGQAIATLMDGTTQNIDIYNATLDTPVAVAPQMVSTSGSGQAHENRQPYTVLTACIALQGIFPNRS